MNWVLDYFHNILQLTDSTVCMWQQKPRLIRPSNVFPSSVVQFWRARARCGLSFLFLADRSTWCGLLPLEPVCFKVRCVKRCSSSDLGYNEWLFELLLPFYQLEPVWPFSSDLCHQQAQRTASLDIFSCLDCSL